MAATVADGAPSGPYYPPGTSGIHFLAAATFGPHSELWQPGALFGRAASFLLSVLELPLHRAKHCSNLRPAAVLQQSRGRKEGEDDSHSALISFFFLRFLSGVSCFLIILLAFALFLDQEYFIFFWFLFSKCPFCPSYNTHLKIYSNKALFGLLTNQVDSI